MDSAKRPKRSLASKHASAVMHSNQPLDSPAYDASEEDNDPLTDDASSVLSAVPSPPSAIRTSRPPALVTRNPPPGARSKHALASSLVSSADEAIDSPTYDGDIESSTTLAPDLSKSSSNHRYAPSIASTLSPTIPPSQLPPPQHVVGDPATSSRLPDLDSPQPQHRHRDPHPHPHPHHHHHHPHNAGGVTHPTPSHPSQPSEPPPANISTLAFNPAKLSPEDIQEYVRNLLKGDGVAVGTGTAKKVYKINDPPKGRPVRIYADGVYDLFHFGHALQLRQAKLSFPPLPPHPHSQSIPTPSASQPQPGVNTTPRLPTASPFLSDANGVFSTTPETEPGEAAAVGSAGEATGMGEWISGVYLLVGVNSDVQCQEHKSKTVMTHAERCESVRHCRWVDEVVPEAPWVIGEEFLQKYKIDYIAHDEDPYGSAGHDDVYAYCKTQGKFLPTRRTPGISTSDLLARLVSGYRHRVWDKKLEKMGLKQLMAEGSDWDESRAGSAEGSRVQSLEGSRAVSPVEGKEKEGEGEKVVVEG